jgi:hypothetical protein
MEMMQRLLPDKEQPPQLIRHQSRNTPHTTASNLKLRSQRTRVA